MWIYHVNIFEWKWYRSWRATLRVLRTRATECEEEEVEEFCRREKTSWRPALTEILRRAFSLPFEPESAPTAPGLPPGRGLALLWAMVSCSAWAARSARLTMMRRWVSTLPNSVSCTARMTARCWESITSHPTCDKNAQAGFKFQISFISLSNVPGVIFCHCSWHVTSTFCLCRSAAFKIRQPHARRQIAGGGVRNFFVSLKPV